MIKRIWLYPPLAFARVGSSPTPCENFYWGPDQLTPGGTARTRIVPAETLSVDEKGIVSAHDPKREIVFRDEHGFRPVCPFFELHAEWEKDGVTEEGPVTPELLDHFGLSETHVNWQVDVVNLKAFHFTGSCGDRVEASVPVPGGCFTRQQLEGGSPNEKEPLIPSGQHIPLGSVQATRPHGKFPEFRLRFTPPSGKAYAPSNIHERLAALPQPQSAQGGLGSLAEVLAALAAGTSPPDLLREFLRKFNIPWRGFKLPPERCLLNPASPWNSHELVSLQDLLAQLSRFLPRADDILALLGPGDRSELIRALRGPHADVGNLPPSVFAFAAEASDTLVSVGMIDDTGDGTISVTLGGHEATARVVIAPPSFAPDRRLPVSIADGLADRMSRDEVRDPAWVSGANRNEADAEVADLLDRAYETVGLQNVDAVADFFRQANEHMALRRDSQLTRQQAGELLWHGRMDKSVEPMPLAARALQRHRRNTAQIFFEIFVRENRDWFEKWVRPPAGPQRFYDKRMPGLMCGFDRRPLHLTRRQYELLKSWSRES
jgi:hypothetical protein